MHPAQRVLKQPHIGKHFASLVRSYTIQHQCCPTNCRTPTPATSILSRLLASFSSSIETAGL